MKNPVPCDKVVLENFDWFNDYKDTRAWAMKVCPEVVPKMDTYYRAWHVQRYSSYGKKPSTTQLNITVGELEIILKDTNISKQEFLAKLSQIKGVI